MKKTILKMFSVLALGCSGMAHAALITGSATIAETDPAYQWGDGQHNLQQQWTLAAPPQSNNGIGSGWFYGSSYALPFSWSLTNADIYVAHGLTDLTQVVDASTFNYSNSSVVAAEGDTVFFRGLNGFFGAWVLKDFWSTTDDPTKNFIDWNNNVNIDWYFQDDGSANFAGANAHVPEPGAFILMLLTGVGAFFIRVARRNH